MKNGMAIIDHKVINYIMHIYIMIIIIITYTDISTFLVVIKPPINPSDGLGHPFRCFVLENVEGIKSVARKLPGSR